MPETAVLFEKCPLCGEGTIYLVRKKTLLSSRREVQDCPVCSAAFALKGDDNYELLRCEPHKIISRKTHGRCTCQERVYRGCYLGLTLPKSEWIRISEGEEAGFLQEFLKMEKEFLRGFLPTYPRDSVAFPLEEDEKIHYVSSPVYFDDAQPSHGKKDDEGTLILTNKRIIFAREPEPIPLPFELIERAEEAPPGFLIMVKENFKPLYFYPPKYDPFLAAVKGALRIFWNERVGQ